MCMHVDLHAYLNAYVQGPEVNLRYHSSSSFGFGLCGGGCFTFVEVGFLAGLELTNYDRLASQWAPGICLYHPSAEVILTGHHTGAFVFVCLLA